MIPAVRRYLETWTKGPQDRMVRADLDAQLRDFGQVEVNALLDVFRAVDLDKLPSTAAQIAAIQAVLAETPV